ncbi:hypothetical protein GCM10009119_18240 [Algoriphagus jejuensis]|uniref:DUF4440 domain-containing protein n=1 Tax=Algoriphagus jejuensis TaxID=419934 RepID=A0ABP3YE17_9BACT
MKKSISLLALFFTLIYSYAQAQDAQEIIQLDLAWEKAIFDSNVEFFENTLAEDFVWVHNHAGTIDNKTAAVNRAKRLRDGQNDTTKSRVSRDHKVIFLGNTAVITGFTVVDRPPSPVNYHFMRTYVKVNGEYKLLANHTMAVPDEEVK